MQRPCQIHLPVGHASGTAEHLSIHHAIARAIVDKARQPGFQRGGCQHRLEDRAHRIGRKSAVQQRAVRCVQAGGNVFRVESRQADAGPHLSGSRIEHDHTARFHRLGGRSLYRPLDGPREGQLNAHCSAVGRGKNRLCACLQGSLRGNGADQRIVCPAARKLRIESSLQPGHTMAFPVQIPQQRRCQRGVAIPPGHSITPHPQHRNIPPYVQQKGPRRIPLLIQLHLPGRFGQRVKAGVASLPRQTESQPAAAHTREQAAFAIVEVAPPRRECQPDGALRRRPGRVNAVGAEPEQTAHQHREGAEKCGVQRQHPATAHGLPLPFCGISRSVWPGKCCPIPFFSPVWMSSSAIAPIFCKNFSVRALKITLFLRFGQKIAKKC